jgi:small subunit ribosomal protein S17
MTTGHRKTREGVVVSDKMDKTVVVVVERHVRHPRYRKYRRLRTRYQAHDQQNRCRVGDRVLLIETRPLSARKRWAVQAILGRSEALATVTPEWLEGESAGQEPVETPPAPAPDAGEPEASS